MSPNRYKIAVVGGDGIGPEVITQGLKVLDAAGTDLELIEYDLGAKRYLRDGTILPDTVLQEWMELDAIYLGAVGDPQTPPGLIERGLLLKMRFELDLYINLRPFKTQDHDFLVVRENSEGPYAGEGGILRKGTPNEIATQGSVNTAMGVQRCVRFAFELALQQKRRLDLVHKTNVLQFSGDLWSRVFANLNQEFPQVETGYDHVDAACIHMVQNPARYGVIVTDNLFGDIITDLAGAVSGGIGLAGSANLNPERNGPSMFEPVHGSAPDIAGQNLANPLAAIISGAMMMDFLGEPALAKKIMKACEATATHSGSTEEIAEAVISKL